MNKLLLKISHERALEIQRRTKPWSNALSLGPRQQLNGVNGLRYRVVEEPRNGTR